MKLAVTAASGQLGSAVVRLLTRTIDPSNIVAIARSPKNASTLGVEVRPGDYDRGSDFREALKGIDAVLLVSSNAKADVRITQHRGIIDAAKANGVQKIVYTSIVGEVGQSAFAPIVSTNRQTELDLKASGLQTIIGRNGLYIEPDLEFVDTYQRDGGIRNCAGDGLCAYTSRDELAAAYSRLLTTSDQVGRTLNLVGTPLSQRQLADLINRHFGLALDVETMDVDAYRRDRVAALGDHMGTIIAGIYESIALGHFNPTSDYEAAAGRPHASPDAMVEAFRAQA